MIKRAIFWIVTLCFHAWGTTLYAQDKALHFEHTLLNTPSLTSRNPALLQHLTDTILFNAQINYNFNKGDYVNYYEANQSHKIEANSQSYIRINKKMVVYGLASYSYSTGQNSNGTSFFNPYRTPFNFTPQDNTTKGDNQVEQYHLVGAMSYKIAERLYVGAKINYKTISFVKLKDMRNINTILDLTASIGINYNFTTNHSLALSYNYNRYIENMRINEYGKLEKDYYALINKGSFMGVLHQYGDKGILDVDFNRPWVDIVHNIGMQYNGNISNKIKAFIELIYKTAKGHYGNDSESSVVYMKHNKNNYKISTQLQVQGLNKTHIVGVKGNYGEISNNEQKYREVATAAGNSITEYDGSEKIFDCVNTTAGITYHLLCNNFEKNTSWDYNFEYNYHSIGRKTYMYPFFRKQDINWHKTRLGVGRFFQHKKINYYINIQSGYAFGDGGNPVDKLYIAVSDQTAKPDYLDHYLHHEREYFTAKRLLSDITLRASKSFKNKEFYLQLNACYVKLFDNKYVGDDFLNTEFIIGMGF